MVSGACVHCHCPASAEQGEEDTYHNLQAGICKLASMPASKHSYAQAEGMRRSCPRHECVSSSPVEQGRYKDAFSLVSWRVRHEWM
eukprot:808154-Pelagomonas_calceolata.AAC.1